MRQKVRQGFVCTSTSISSYADCQMGGDTTNQHSNVLPLSSPQHLSSPCLPHQWSKKPAHACQSRSGSRPLAQGCLCGKWDKPSRRNRLAFYNIMQIRKRPGDTRLGETLHDQGYNVRLCIHPLQTRGEARAVHAHTRQEVPPAFTSIYYVCILQSRIVLFTAGV